jgi:hypothetical protein
METCMGEVIVTVIGVTATVLSALSLLPQIFGPAGRAPPAIFLVPG